MGRVGFRHIDLSGYRLNAEIQEAIEDAGWWTFGTLGIPVNPDESTLQDFSFAVNTDAEEDESLRAARLPCSSSRLGRDARRLRPGAGRAARRRRSRLRCRSTSSASRSPTATTRGSAASCSRRLRWTMPLAAAVYRFRGLAASARARRGGHALRHAPAQHDAPDRRGRPTAGLESDRPSTIALRYLPMTETLRGVDLVIPTDATILALVGENDFVYPLYGPWLERRVHTVSGRELGRDRWTNALRLADERGADWIIDNSGVEVEDAPGWELVYRFPDNGWTLLRRAAR